MAGKEGNSIFGHMTSSAKYGEFSRLKFYIIKHPFILSIHNIIFHIG